MSYTCGWLIPNRVIELRYEGDIDSEEVFASYHTLRQFCAAADEGQLHICIDVCNVRHYTHEIVRLHNKIRLDTPSKYGWMVIVGQNPVAVYNITTLCGLLRLRFRVFSMMRAALAFLREQDTSLQAHSS